MRNSSGGEFVLLMLAGGALAGGIVALIAPGLWWLQLIVFALVSVGLVVGLRPALKRKYLAPSPIKTGMDAVIGSKALVISTVDGERRPGQDRRRGVVGDRGRRPPAAAARHSGDRGRGAWRDRRGDLGSVSLPRMPDADVAHCVRFTAEGRLTDPTDRKVRA